MKHHLFDENLLFQPHTKWVHIFLIKCVKIKQITVFINRTDDLAMRMKEKTKKLAYK